MTSQPDTLPLLIEPAQLEPLLGSPNLLIVDLCRPEQYAAAHLPGAVFLPYTQLSPGGTPGGRKTARWWPVSNAPFPASTRSPITMVRL